MSASLPHYKMGPASLQVATLIFGGQLVQANTAAFGGTDYTVKPALSASTTVLGVAGNDANVLTAQTGSPNTYGEPLIDMSVLTDYCAVYAGGYDIWAWYAGQATQGQKLGIHSSNVGAVVGLSAAPAADQVVGVCTHPGGVANAMLTQAIGGLGSATFFFGRMRIF
jgi:hypothetical protein